MNQAQQLTDYIRKKYNAVVRNPWMKNPEHTTFTDRYSEKWFALIMKINQKTLGIKGDSEIYVVNVKADPEFISLITGVEGYFPAYHMNKRHWLTILLDGTLPIEQIYDRVDESYHLISDTPTRRIYEAVKQIPKGKVATYGQVALLAGDKNMARAVGNALHKNPAPDEIPCYRVVNAKGELAGEFAFGGEGAQANLLIADGIEVSGGKVDLKKYGMDLQ